MPMSRAAKVFIKKGKQRKMPMTRAAKVFIKNSLLRFVSGVAENAGVAEKKVQRFISDPKTIIQIENALQMAWSVFNGPIKPFDSPSLDQSPLAPALPDNKEAPPGVPKPIPQHTPVMLPPPSPVAPLVFRLGNGRVGQHYKATLELVTVNAPAYVLESILPHPYSGLTADHTIGEISGVPTKDGEVNIDVWYVINGQSAAQCSSVKLTINPDPKSLWKDLPSNTADPYWKQDQAGAVVQGDGLVLAAVSKRGRSHAHVGSFRDDDFHLDYLPEGQWHIAIVSDGAGSAKFSRRGAQIICRDGGMRLRELLLGKDGPALIAACEAWQQANTVGQPTDAAANQIKNLLYTTIGYAAHHATKLLQDEIKLRPGLGGVFKDYSATAIFSVSRRFSFGVLCAAYWVGDGAVAAIENSGKTTLLGDADAGEFSGQTRFLDPSYVTQEELLKRIRFVIVPDFKALVLMTDGVSDPFFEVENHLVNSAKWAALWADLEAKASISHKEGDLADRLVNWLDFWSPGNHDDRTLALVY